MLIGVISDTHGDRNKIRECLPHLEKVEYILHAGDYYEDAQIIAAFTRCKVIAVTGNCDYMVRGPVEEMLVLGGKRIYLTHGHIYKVKQDLSLLIKRARALGTEIAVFGHTHAPQVFRRDGLLFVNPGSLHSPRQGYHPSFALLEIVKRSAKARIISLLN
ncbi:MAG TPA: metallophosphoesterase [Firmicutes bacterium]|nr:metallophosphoesterase [Bacillota bacterium]